MTDKLLCDEHGESEATFVCMHIAQSLNDGVPRGFNWALDEDGNHQAICSDCDALTDAEWEEVSGTNGKALCLGCFKRAASVNGITIGDSGHA